MVGVPHHPFLPAPPTGFRDFGFRIWVLGFRVSDFGFRSLGLRFRVFGVVIIDE
jgi:hypothetical protein